MITDPENLAIGPELQIQLTHQILNTTGALLVTSYQLSTPNAKTGYRFNLLFEAIMAAPRRRRPCRLIMAQGSPLTPASAANRRNANTLTRAGWEIRHAPRSPTMHAKVWIFGEEKLCIGSHNLTEAALSRNREVSILTSNRTMITRMHLYFAEMWDASTPHKLE